LLLRRTKDVGLMNRVNIKGDNNVLIGGHQMLEKI